MRLYYPSMLTANIGQPGYQSRFDLFLLSPIGYLNSKFGSCSLTASPSASQQLCAHIDSPKQSLQDQARLRPTEAILPPSRVIRINWGERPIFDPIVNLSTFCPTRRILQLTLKSFVARTGTRLLTVTRETQRNSAPRVSRLRSIPRGRCDQPPHRSARHVWSGQRETAYLSSRRTQPPDTMARRPSRPVHHI